MWHNCYRMALSITLVLGFVNHGWSQVDIEVTDAEEFNEAYRLQAAGKDTDTPVTIKASYTGNDNPGYDTVTFRSESLESPKTTSPSESHAFVVPKGLNDQQVTITAILSKGKLPVEGATSVKSPRRSSGVVTANADSDDFLPPFIEPDTVTGNTIQQVAATDAKPAQISTTFRILVDSKAPRPLQPVVERYPSGGATLTVDFAEADTKMSTAVLKESYRILEEYQNENRQTYYSIIPIDTVEPTGDGKSVKINVRQLNPGVYYLQVQNVSDLVGNPIPTFKGTSQPDPADVQFRFTVNGGQQRGEQVPYPRFLNEEDKKKEFTTGDRVDTRVVQLYYLRDARQVAEIINRNIQDLNQHSYDEAQRFAAAARTTAADRIDSRRFQETIAVEDAQATRAKENALERAREDYQNFLVEDQKLQELEKQHEAALAQQGVTEKSPLSSLVATSSEAVSTKSKTLADGENSQKMIPKLEALVASLEVDVSKKNDKRIDATADFDKSDRDYKKAKAVSDDMPTEGNNSQTTKLEKERAQNQQALDSATAAWQLATEKLAKAKADLLGAEKIDPEVAQEELLNEQRRLSTLSILQTNDVRLTKRRKVLDAQKEPLEKDLKQLPIDIANAQTKEIKSRNEVVTAEAQELRAAQEQFRREVVAGMADRNSYAKGELTSIDPVTQTTISVVGTSRLQLRGPIKGINKICRMVHQLDSPVGQVKLGIHTVQVNGEHGDRMDFVYERINQEIAHSRFLTNTSGQMFRKAVHEVAAAVALEADQGYLPEGCPPELIEGVSKTRGRRSSKSKIVQVNGEYIDSGLPIDGGIVDGMIVEGQPGIRQTDARMRERRYLYAFFGSDFIGELEEMDSELLNSENKLLSLNSMDTISLAGALFVTAHADHPIRMRIIDRFQELIQGELPERETQYIAALTHVDKCGKSLRNRFREAMKIDNRNNAEIYFNAQRTYHFPNTISFFNDQIPGQGTMNPVQYATVKLAQTLKAQLVAEMELKNHVLERSLLETKEGETEEDLRKRVGVSATLEKVEIDRSATMLDQIVEVIPKCLTFARSDKNSDLGKLTDAEYIRVSSKLKNSVETPTSRKEILERAIDVYPEGPAETFGAMLNYLSERILDEDNTNELQFISWFNILAGPLRTETEEWAKIEPLAVDFYKSVGRAVAARDARIEAEKDWAEAEENVFSKRLLDQFIDEQEEKSVELMEALRSHSSNVDNYLKRLAIAVEDDVAAQFYEPAFQRIRRVSRTWDVTLGQVETTTVLTNNRTLAKVDPAATFEFNLPQRDILLTEALNGSKALATEYGNLLKDGTFLAGTAMLSGAPPAGVVGDNAPIQGIPGLSPQHEFGSELQKLIPDSAIYKFETGTGFEIRPIIQPDGHSIVYGFDYMYSTNVREPVRADEKHLGRIKRHFVHTDVQTSSYELREISRYTVALKASRTDRGVPLFEDLPGVGAAFRPLPSDESSLQTNIILGSSTIYPTVYDLMGLRWSPYVDDLASASIADQKVIQSDRRIEMRTQLLNRTRHKVNGRIGIQSPTGNSLRRVPPGAVIGRP